MDDTKSPILKSAIESFGHGLEHFINNEPIDRKFAILHVDQAVELILKEKLASKGESVYKGTNETLNLHETFKKLERNNIKIPEKPRIEQTHEIRNMIQHRGHTPDEKSTEFYIKIEYDFIKRFLKTEMNEDISNYIKPEIKAHFEGYEPSSSKNQIKSAYKQINENPTGAILGIFGALEFTVYQDFPNENLPSIISKLREKNSINDFESKELLKAYKLRHKLSSDNLYNPSVEETRKAIEIVSNVIKKISGQNNTNKLINLDHFPEMIDNYFEIKKFKESTVKSYKNVLDHFYMFLIARQNIYTTKELIKSFKTYIILQKNNSESYIYLTNNVIKNFLEFYGIETHNIKSPKRIKTNYDILTEHEVKKLIHTKTNSNRSPKLLNLRNKIILTLVYSPGLKASELIQINIEDVDIANKEIIIHNQEKDRIVSFNKETKILMEEYLKKRKDKNKLLLINRSGNPLTTRSIQMLIQKSAKVAGIKKKVTPHILKRSFEAHILEKGTDIISISDTNDNQSSLDTT